MTIPLTDDVVLRPLVVPDTLDAPDASDFIDMVRVRNAVFREISGHDDHAHPPEELLPHFRPEPYNDRLAWVIVWRGEVCGRVVIDFPLEEGSRVAFVSIEILRSAQGRGLGRAAYAVAEEAIRERGRSVIQSWIEHPPAEGERLEAPTGFGSVPLDRSARFALCVGATLEQIERMSALDLTAPGIDDRLRAARAGAEASAAGYRVVTWSLPTPEEYVEGYARMKARMVTDAPAAGMEFDDEVWDAARVRVHEAPYLESGSTMQVTAAQHVETGELAAFNELVVGGDHRAVSHQEDTLVLAAHRGHRLGMLVKTAGLVAWRERFPDTPRVITYNAEENRFMLSVNEAIGFAPIAYEGAWKTILAE